MHLAEILSATGRAGEAEAMLRPALASGDPEASWRLADVLNAEGRVDEAALHLEAARSGFERLLEKHLLAFADHGAEFYIGSGGDPLRALELAQINLSESPDAPCISANLHHRPRSRRDRRRQRNFRKSDKALGEFTRFPIFALCARFIGSRKRSSRMIVDRRVFVAGAALAAIRPHFGYCRPMPPCRH